MGIQYIQLYDLLQFMLKIETSTGETNSMPFLVLRFAVRIGDHFRFDIIAVQFGDHFRSGIICGAAHIYPYVRGEK